MEAEPLGGRAHSPPEGDEVGEAEGVAGLGRVEEAPSMSSFMRQIREKRYFEPFLADGRRIALVGVAFSKKTRNLGKCLIEPV